MAQWWRVVAFMCVLVVAMAGATKGQGGARAKGKGMEDNTKDREDPGKGDPRPNVILLLADDLGFGDLSFSGHPTSRTPHIDSIAARSRYLTQFYVTSPICSPSRASILTGRGQVRSGVYPGVFLPDNTLGLPRNETTIAHLLAEQGYRTLAVGKWHLGVGREFEYLPTHFGFHEYLGVPYSHDMCPCLVCFPGQLPCHDTCWNWDVSCPLFSNTTIVEQPVDLPTITQQYVNKALHFIRDSHHARQPFFLYFPTHQVHHPQFASHKFHGKSPRGVFGDALRELDWLVGELNTYLKKLNIHHNTVLWFASDNGPSMTRHERGGCAGPLRCGKGTTWDGGVRVPSFIHWPAKVKPGRSNGLVSGLDILPTLAALTNASTSHLTLDGVDVSPLLWDADELSPRKMFAVYSDDPHPSREPFAVTDGRFKAHYYTRGSDLSDANNYDPMCPASHKVTPHDPPLLFDLHRDPGERYDLGTDDQYQPILEMLSQWRAEHRTNMTWIPPRTRTIDPLAQPCCSPSCSPFPTCCDCPTAA